MQALQKRTGKPLKLVSTSATLEVRHTDMDSLLLGDFKVDYKPFIVTCKYQKRDCETYFLAVFMGRGGTG